MANPKTFAIEKQGEETLVRFTEGVLDADVFRLVAGPLVRTIGDMLCLDLEHVQFLTGATLGKLVTLHRELEDRGGHLVIRNVQPMIYEIFQAVRLTAILAVEEVETAQSA